MDLIFNFLIKFYLANNNDIHFFSQLLGEAIVGFGLLGVYNTTIFLYLLGDMSIELCEKMLSALTIMNYLFTKNLQNTFM